MNILFVVDCPEQSGDPNLQLVQNVIRVFEQHHTVQVLGHTVNQSKTTPFLFFYDKDENMRRLRTSLQNLSPIRKLARLLAHPVLAFGSIFKLFNVDWISRAYQKHIERLARQCPYDVVISISAPFYTSKALSKSKLATKKILWIMDPYGTHYLFGSRRTLWMERRAIQRADHVFVPMLLEQRYQQQVAPLCQGNITGVEFPALVCPHPGKTAEGIHLDPRYTNLVYTGSFYPDIRPADALFSTFFSIADSSLFLTVVGDIPSQLQEELRKKYGSLLQTQVRFTGVVSPNIAAAYTIAADILVNLGNRIENQLPSKLIAYFATGKPILNVSLLPNCPSNLYIEHYPLGFSLYAYEMNSDVIASAQKFIVGATGAKGLSWASVKELYRNCTPAAVAARLQQAF